MSSLPTLTNDQQAAADAFAMFLVSPHKEFVISGGAGVGKSTLLRYLEQSSFLENVATMVGAKIPDLQWRYTATTNKAAEVLQSMGFLEATTIHSLLGIRVYNDFDNGTSRAERKPNSPIIRDSLIFVDECSMVDRNLRKLIGEGTFNCKIVYIGDHCQMAPITEQLSTVFTDNQTVIINEIVRSKGAPPITSLCKQLRETVETGLFKPIKGVPGFVDYLTPEEAQAEITRHFVQNQGHSDRILYFRNESVIAMNDWIRQQRNLPPEFVPGETLISSGATYAMNTVNGQRYMLRVEEEVRIRDVSESTLTNLRAYDLDAQIETYTVTTDHGEFLIAKNPNDLKLCLNALSKRKNWRQFFTLKEAFADLRMREACTVYKAQGSTYQDVFVDLTDIGRCNNPAQAARMLYVACSRPTNRICFIGRLPEKYGG